MIKIRYNQILSFRTLFNLSSGLFWVYLGSLYLRIDQSLFQMKISRSISREAQTRISINFCLRTQRNRISVSRHKEIW